MSGPYALDSSGGLHGRRDGVNYVAIWRFEQDQQRTAEVQRKLPGRRRMERLKTARGLGESEIRICGCLDAKAGVGNPVS